MVLFFYTFPLLFCYFSTSFPLLFWYFSATFLPLFCYFSSTFLLLSCYFSASFLLLFLYFSITFPLLFRYFSLLFHNEGASWWRVCYQRGLPCLVFFNCIYSDSSCTLCISLNFVNIGKQLSNPGQSQRDGVGVRLILSKPSHGTSISPLHLCIRFCNYIFIWYYGSWEQKLRS